MAGAKRMPFRRDRLVLAVPRGHDLEKRGTVTMAEVAPYPFILRTRSSGMRHFVEDRLGRRFDRLTIALELEGNSEIISCVEAGLGIALVSQGALARARALGTVVALDIEDVDFEREFFVALSEDRTSTEATNTFVRWLTENYQHAHAQLITRTA
ncbi:MAG: LysR substrate-binding domain-containing protein [Vulcanimicrobiaceae bacterium]